MLAHVHTLYWGQCYLIRAYKTENSPNSTSTALNINLSKNESVALMYILPNVVNSEISAAIALWNQPVKPIELSNGNFVQLTFRKEIYVQHSTEGFPCTESEEEVYYKVKLIWKCQICSTNQIFTGRSSGGRSRNHFSGRSVRDGLLAGEVETFVNIWRGR